MTNHTIIECTEKAPWDGILEPEQRVRHHGASEVSDSQEDGWPGGDTIRVRCEYCGTEWTEELPQ